MPRLLRFDGLGARLRLGCDLLQLIGDMRLDHGQRAQARRETAEVMNIFVPLGDLGFGCL